MSRRANTRDRVGDAADARHIAEMPAAFVVKQVVASDRGDVDVFPAVVIEVAHGYAHAVNIDIETAAARDVGEGSVTVVSIERRGGVASA